MKIAFLILSFLFLIILEITRVYFIMPFPGSQYDETINIAYWIHKNLFWLRLIGWLLIAVSLFLAWRNAKKSPRFIAGAGLSLYIIVFYFFNFRMLAEKMFIQPQEKIFSTLTDNKIPESKLVIGITQNGESKAYPIQIIGYHHQVRDTVGKIPIMVTYCTVCRTGRVFSPIVAGQPENFRLVGMDHFNAMFEDSKTGSWWRQATGVAVAGPLKDSVLNEIPSQQTSLAAWIKANPSTKIMQYDPSFMKDYEDLEEFDIGTIKSSLEKRDSASWKFKSWVVGIYNDRSAKAYDWNELLKKKFIQDSLPDLPVLLVLEKDSVSFHAFNRMLGTNAINFEWKEETQQLRDQLTGSLWNLKGECTEGPLAGTQMDRIQAYQEFWHSWKSFHPKTKKFPE
ncbi:DUF3179 domain-containing (seleno)protein [Flavihumibacter sp. UBA7668]|uniref:DUF3179 domain-containing (seleno)protein n=1 Tax=Flavihumibacter sp. UBA7668 TaxID=1946542 RepID=UPI0025BC6B9B|nr:DUF3179 domain-containing (seleno)protein [Flavihumibacter sp. UBA7668]